MKVCFVPSNIDAAGCYRCIYPMAHLRERGWDASMPSVSLQQRVTRVEVERDSRREIRRWEENIPVPVVESPYGTLLPNGDYTIAYRLDELPEADVTVFHLGTDRFMHDLAETASGRVVLDLDDDVFRIPAYQASRRLLDPAVSPDRNRRWTRKLIDRADHVTVTTEALAELYGQWADVTVLPNYLHWPMWQDATPVYEQTWRKVRVGYMGVMDYHQADLETIAPVLREFLEAHPEVEFVAAGDPRIHDVVGTPEAQRVSLSRTYFRAGDLADITATFDIGLVPLVRNDFNEGKSHLKGLEYAACGIPCIATPTGPYRGWVDEGHNGFLARHPRDWRRALGELVGDAELRERMGRCARVKAREFSLDRHVGEWEAVYAGLCPDADRARERGVAA